MARKTCFSLSNNCKPIKAAPKSPETHTISFTFAVFLYTIFCFSAKPKAVIEITKPDLEAEVSPPTKSTLYSSQAILIPSYNSVIASTEIRLLKPMLTVICFGMAFMAAMSEILTATALYPNNFSGQYDKSK